MFPRERFSKLLQLCTPPVGPTPVRRARETIEQNVVADINEESGRATVNPDKLFTRAGQEFMVCPSALGGKNCPAGTCSPTRG